MGEAGPTKAERHCPVCGVRVAKTAKTCLMCGAQLANRRPPPALIIAIPLAIVLIVLIIGSALLILSKPGRRELAMNIALTLTTTPTPIATNTPVPTSTSTPTLSPTPTPTSSPTSVPSVVHTVRAGDSLFSIAARYSTTVEAIMAANSLADPKLVRIGQELIIPLGMPTPTPTPTSTSTPTSQPTPTSALSLPYPAPALLAPADGETFWGAEEVILLNWASVGILAEDEWYVLRLRCAFSQPPSVWTKATSWRVPAELYPPSDAAFHLFQWDVTVARQMGTGPEGTLEGIAISPTSVTRSFYWY